MTRAPFVMGKSSAAYARTAKLEDTTMGWRFVNRTFEADYGVDSMPVTAENVADRRSEEHTSELQSLMRISYAVFCLKKKKYGKHIVPITSNPHKGTHH